MSQSDNVVEECGIELPASAPQIRVTAGYGSAGQKTWNLRRPVTLVGSKRPAHIVLHGRDISVAHCAIINTGADVLLFDLHTSSGTYCNKDRVCLAALKDGDVITIGDTKIQVAIRMPTGDADDSGCGEEFVEPTRFRNPLMLSLIHTDKQWKVEEAAVLIGRHDHAAIRLDNPEISMRHAILFRFGGGPVLFDLGSRSGVWVNGQRCEISMLVDGDRLTIGPFGIGVCVPDRKPSRSEISNLKSQNLRAISRNGPGRRRCPGPRNRRGREQHGRRRSPRTTRPGRRRPL
ncbi:MAG: FHA domain-containing protein [Phycisphaerales bacterium]|nr:FHA domain-containing protein [Phycisphaerales bacterium]